MPGTPLLLQPPFAKIQALWALLGISFPCQRQEFAGFYLDVFWSQVAFHVLFPLWWRGRFVGWREVNPAGKEEAAEWKAGENVLLL